jgi:hypothetical protein
LPGLKFSGRYYSLIFITILNFRFNKPVGGVNLEEIKQEVMFGYLGLDKDYTQVPGGSFL